MKSTDLLMVAKTASAIDTALDAASWVPGFVGAGAGAVQGVKHLAQGNVLKGLGSLGMGAAQMFGGGTALKLLGKGLGYGSKLMKGTSMGAKALGGASQIGSRVAQATPTFASGFKRIGSTAYKGLAPETTRIGNSTVGKAIQNNSGKLMLGGMGAGIAGGMQEAGEQSAQAFDQGILSNMKGMAQSAQESVPDPIWAQGSGNSSQGNPLQNIPGMLAPQQQYS